MVDLRDYCAKLDPGKSCVKDKETKRQKDSRASAKVRQVKARFHGCAPKCTATLKSKNNLWAKLCQTHIKAYKQKQKSRLDEWQ